MMPIRLTLVATATLVLSACAMDPGHYHHKWNANLPAETGSSAVVSGLPIADLAAAQRLLTSDETLHVLTFPESGTTTVTGRIVGRQSLAHVLPSTKASAWISPWTLEAPRRTSTSRV